MKKPLADQSVKHDVGQLDSEGQKLVRKLLVEGSTFEDVVETVNERGGQRVTVNAVKNYFQGDLEVQKERVRRQIKNAQELLACVDKDPKSAEAQLAQATFLTGYERVHRNSAVVTPGEAVRYRLQNENLNLRRKILEINKKKAE